MGTRADNGDGSCRLVEKGYQAGKWRVQFTQLNDLGNKQRLSRFFASKTEAKEFLQGLRRGAKIETIRKGREVTLGQWLDWLAENDWPETLDGKTIGYRLGRFNRHVRPHFGVLSY